MTAEEGRAACGTFGCVTGRGERHGHNVKVFGKVIMVDSYYLWFVTTCDIPLLFRLKYIESYYSIPEGKRLLKIPQRYKKFVFLHSENERILANVANDAKHS